MLQGKKIVIGVTASIAAFKVPLLVRLFKKEGAEIKIMMTPAAVDFVTPLTLSTLSGNPVLIEPFNPIDGSWNSHVELGRWADVFIIAPASANTIAKMAGGIADNFLLTAYLSAKCPVFFAPAMDLDMFRHPVTQKNIKTLQSHGNKLIEPAIGELASGLAGPGRMEEPEIIFNIISDFFKQLKGPFAGKKVLVTAGPTYEAIDPVRFIGNHSSGLMGFSIAHEFAEQGAEVTLVSGPVNIIAGHPNISRIDVTSADEMLRECTRYFKTADITVMAAAVADYKPKKSSDSKIKKKGTDLVIEFTKTIDILEKLGKIKKNDQILVGFALETDNELKNASQKLKKKNLDLIILNSLKDKGAGFGTTTNKITIISSKGKTDKYPLKSKEGVAKDILEKIKTLL